MRIQKIPDTDLSLMTRIIVRARPGCTLARTHTVCGNGHYFTSHNHLQSLLDQSFGDQKMFLFNTEMLGEPVFRTLLENSLRCLHYWRRELKCANCPAVSEGSKGASCPGLCSKYFLKTNKDISYACIITASIL